LRRSDKLGDLAIEAVELRPTAETRSQAMNDERPADVRVAPVVVLAPKGARQRDQRHVVDRLAVIAGEDDRRASRLADGFERSVTEWNDEDVRAITGVLHLLGRTAPDTRLEVDLVEAHEASGTRARGRQSE
jgi:hypothetical protein